MVLIKQPIVCILCLIYACKVVLWLGIILDSLLAIDTMHLKGRAARESGLIFSGRGCVGLRASIVQTRRASTSRRYSTPRSKSIDYAVWKTWSRPSLVQIKHPRKPQSCRQAVGSHREISLQTPVALYHGVRILWERIVNSFSRDREPTR